MSTLVPLYEKLHNFVAVLLCVRHTRVFQAVATERGSGCSTPGKFWNFLVKIPHFGSF